MSAFKLFMVPNLRCNSVVNTELPVILSHRRCPTISLETYPLDTNDRLTKNLDKENELIGI